MTAAIRHALQNLRAAIVGKIRRGVVRLITEGQDGLQLVQVEIERGVVSGMVEVAHPYGLISHAGGGAAEPEAVVLAVGPDHLITLGAFDRTARPTDTAPGESGLYHREGHRIRLQAGGVVRIESGSRSITLSPSSATIDGDVIVLGNVQVDDVLVGPSSTSFLGHTHPGVTSGPSNTGPPNP